MKILIIGGCAAGAAAAARLSREMKDAQIEIFEKSSKNSFSNCGLPYGISGVSDPDTLAPKDASGLEKRGMKVHLFHEAIEILEKDKKVKVRNVQTDEISEHSYDKLIVTPGARALTLPIEGLKEEKKVFSLRTYDDMRDIIDNMKDVKNVLIIGGGFIGVELAENFQMKGMNVTLVEKRVKLAGFDTDFSSFLEDDLEKNGIKVIVGKGVDKVDAKNKKFFIDNESFDYDMIVTTGITPNTEMFKSTSIKVDEKGIVNTNKFMQTENPDIYAAGDIVYTPHVVTKKDSYAPMARQAKTQGRVIADHIAGNESTGQHPTTGAGGFGIFGKIYAHVGLKESAANALKIPNRIIMATVNATPSYIPHGKITMKMIFNSENHKLIGLQAMGFGADKAVDSFAVALISEMTIYDLERINFAYQPHFSTTLNPLNTMAQLAINELRLGFRTECPMHIHFHEPERLIIDTRSKEMHDASHIEGAINIPTSQLSKETIGKDFDHPIAVHCNSGFGSSIAARKLKELGYKDVLNIEGGNNLYQVMKKKYSLFN